MNFFQNDVSIQQTLMYTDQNFRTGLARHKCPSPNSHSQLSLQRSTPKNTLQPLSLSNLNSYSNYYQHSPRHKANKTPANSKQQRMDLEMQCMREQIEIESYIKMIERVKGEMQRIEKENGQIYNRVQSRKQELTELTYEYEAMDNRGLGEVERLLAEVQAEERRVRQVINQKQQGSDDAIEGRIIEICEEVDQLRRAMGQEEKRCQIEFNGMMVFIQQLEKERDQLMRQIAEGEAKEKDNHVYVLDYDKIR